jgi:hypothetical protein
MKYKNSAREREEGFKLQNRKEEKKKFIQQ